MPKLLSAQGLGNPTLKCAIPPPATTASRFFPPRFNFDLDENDSAVNRLFEVF